MIVSDLGLNMANNVGDLESHEM